MKTISLLISALLAATSAHAGTIINPIEQDLTKKVIRVHVQNTDSFIKEYDVVKSADWMLVAPSHITLEPGKTAVIKVGRKVDRGDRDLEGILLVKQTGTDVSIGTRLRVPAADK